jgi:PilZ domain
MLLRKAVILLVESGEETTSHEATTADISLHGVRVHAHAELTPGQVIHLVQPEDPTDTLRCLVVWTADVSSDGEGEAGLEFLQSYSTPSES